MQELVTSVCWLPDDSERPTVCGLGDPLKLYIEDLVMAGFRMDISVATGEPCVFARRKN